MKSAVYMGYKGLAWIIFAAVLLQFFFAGIGAFGEELWGDGAFDPHRLTGLLLILLSLLLLILAAISFFTGSMGGRTVGMAGLLLVLMIVQLLLVGFFYHAADVPLLAALHPVNALVLLGISYTLARGRRLSQMAEAGPETASAQPSRVR